MDHPPIYAVLTGDLIGSRNFSADQVEAAFEGMRTWWGVFSEHHPEAVVGSFEVFRGDGWQVALAKPDLALTAAVFLRAAAKGCPAAPGLDTRIGLGLGTVERLEPTRLGTSQGAAFVASGEALEALASLDRGWHLLPEISGMSAITMPLLDLAVRRWSPVLSVYALGALLGWTYQKTADHPWALKDDGTPPSDRAVGAALRHFGWTTHFFPALEAAREVLESNSDPAHFNNKPTASRRASRTSARRPPVHLGFKPPASPLTI